MSAHATKNEEQIDASAAVNFKRCLNQNKLHHTIAFYPGDPQDLKTTYKISYIRSLIKSYISLHVIGQTFHTTTLVTLAQHNTPGRRASCLYNY